MFYFENLSLIVVSRHLQMKRYYFGTDNLGWYGLLYCVILAVCGDFLRFLMRKPFLRYLVLLIIIISGIILSWIYVFSYA